MSGLDHVPDVRDGLTLAERAVLLASSPAGEPFEKSAQVLGRAVAATGLGSAELYDPLVRLAQHWRTSQVLIEGQGNFGSIDDDPPADAVYTEVRRTELGDAIVGAARLAASTEMTADDAAADVRERPVDEPLASPFPQLLANGSWEGIANIPPHHLGELAAAVGLRIDDPSCSLSDILAVMPGPDYPTGGSIVDHDAVRDAYATGRGAIRVRATTRIESGGSGEEPGHGFGPAVHAFDEVFDRQVVEDGDVEVVDIDEDEPRGGSCVVVIELPYLVSKGGEQGVIGQAVDAVLDRRVPTVIDIQDYSDRCGMRLVFEIREQHDPEAARDELLVHTDLEVDLPILLVALVDGEPRQLTLLELLDHYIAHQREVRGDGPDVDAAIIRDLDALAAAHGNPRRTRLPAR